MELSTSTTRSNGWCIFHWVGIVWCFASKARSAILPAENAATTDFSSVAIIVSWKGVGGTKEGETKCPAKGRGNQTNKNYRLVNNTTNQIWNLLKDRDQFTLFYFYFFTFTFYFCFYFFTSYFLFLLLYFTFPLTFTFTFTFICSS